MNERALGLAILLATLLAIVQPSCLEPRTSERSTEARCATCHGDPSRAGDFLARAAPPADLLGATRSSYPGVGAHSIHLTASETHAPIACSECHVVPDVTEAPGHADDDRPAEIVFGELARSGDRQPHYDALARRCSDSYCHREANAVWTEPRDSKQACGSCHGLPPPAPHPEAERCSACHGAVIDAEQRIVEPALHVDGRVQVEAGSCTACHGSGTDPAPPVDTLGGTSASALGVGAHRVHLSGGAFSRKLACAECHSVPAHADDPGHADALPAEVTLNGVAAAGGRTPRWERTRGVCADTACHAAVSPPWTQAGSLGCASCHGTPPPAPHPQIADCSRCHAAVVAKDDASIVDRELHVNGRVEVEFDPGCTSCHDVASAPGFGAHRTHLAGTPRARAVPCAECHRVPMDVLAPGHLDSPPPAELAFSGAATAFGATPVYENGGCRRTACHGNATPRWTAALGTQATCGSCHGLPPPAPHPRADLNPTCSACHENIGPDNVTFVHPELHVDGIVTFALGQRARNR